MSDEFNIYKEIKNELVNNEVNKRIKDYSKNRYELETYYRVGKLLSDAGKHYGEGIIKKYSVRLTNELGKGYTSTNLKYMRQFYYFVEKSHAVRDQLSWTHYRELLSFDDISKINYYVKITEEQNLSYRKLHEKIKSNEYERLDDKTKNKLINHEKKSIEDFIKNPILIRNKNNYQEISEKILQRMILEDMSSFLKELGDGFCFIDNEYKIKIGNTYNYIDLLLFNIKYNCYVVIELKIRELKKDDIGQIEVYMNCINDTLKGMYQDKTIGIIITKKDNKYIMAYCSDKRILNRTYELA